MCHLTVLMLLPVKRANERPPALSPDTFLVPHPLSFPSVSDEVWISMLYSLLVGFTYANILTRPSCLMNCECLSTKKGLVKPSVGIPIIGTYYTLILPS